MGKEALIKGVDYEVTYSNNRDAGTATAIITGKGNYYGAKKVTFKILPIATLNKAKFAFDKTSVTYTGNAYEIGKGIHAAVTLNGTTLVEGKDYTCSYLKIRMLAPLRLSSPEREAIPELSESLLRLLRRK